MLLQGLQTNSSLKVFHFSSLEELRSFERLNETHVLPLSGKCSSTHAVVKLSTGTLVVQRTFPRILDLNCNAGGTLCAVPLVPLKGVRINGVSIRSNSVLVVRGEANLHIVEPHANLFAILHLDPAAAGYGWAKGPPGLRLFEAGSSADLRTFRSTTKNLLTAASQQPQDVLVLRKLEELLLASLESAMSAHSAIVMPSHFSRHLRIIEQMDEYQTLYPDADSDSNDLAAYCGVSPRTLQNATTSVRGMSVHRYIRLRKLWSVRRVLTIGRPGTVISDVARANGFRHMGEFSQAYRSTFGETASATLTKNRRQELSKDLPFLVNYDPNQVFC
jgi:AraC-like DNA-binding protein